MNNSSEEKMAVRGIILVSVLEALSLLLFHLIN
jgi:hypothetical protein